MIQTWILWFLTAIIFAIIEIVTASFFMIWFGVGALGAMVVSLFIPSIPIQFFVFIIVSSVLLLMTRKLTSKLTNHHVIPMNIDSVIGKVGMVMEDIPALENPGIVKVGGEMWSAISHDLGSIPKGTKVEVLQVSGVKLVVQTLISDKE